MADYTAFTPPRQGLLKEANYESGVIGDYWDSVEHQGSAPDPIASNDRARVGTYSQKSVCPGQSNYRSEASDQAHRFQSVQDGAQLFFGFSFYLVSPWPDNAQAFVFQSVMQWHQDNATPNSPPITLAVNNDPSFGVGQRGKICLGGGRGGAANYTPWSQVLMNTSDALDTWTDVVVWMNCTQAVGASQVKCWINGTDVFGVYTIPSCPLIYPDAGSGALIYPKMGLYRDANITTTNTVYHDNYRIGISYTAVQGGA